MNSTSQTITGLLMALATAAISFACFAQPAAAQSPPATAPLAAKDIKLDGWKLTIIPLNQTVEIEPITLKPYKHVAELQDGTPGWRGPLLLPGPAWAFRALHEETLTAALADDPARKLQPGTDFALDTNWAAVAAIEGSNYPAGTKVQFEYQYGLSRLDLLEQAPDGKLVLIKGLEDKSQPRLPDATPGNRPLAGIYLPNYARGLTPDMINLIDPAYDGVPPVVGRQYIEKIRTKLSAGEPTTIVFFGDSITAQTMKDFRDLKGSFVDRFVDHLKTAYPKMNVVLTPAATTVEPEAGQIIVVKAGVGGSDTRQALKRLEQEVLPHKSDLVVIMFGVNDENGTAQRGNSVPVDEYRTNLTTLVQQIRNSGSEALIMTTSMKNLGWSSTVGNLDAYAATARQVAAENKVCLIDNFAAWQALSKRGYNYMVLLGNCINHPVDIGHDVFFRGLKAAFTAVAADD